MEYEQKQTETCISIIHKNVRVEALVTIKPTVKVTEGFSIECAPCKDEEDSDFQSSYPRFGLNKYKSKDKKTDECRFTVTQDLCIKIPLKFEANAFVKPGEVICDTEPDCLDDDA